jgi:hypothetical protein
MKENLFIANRIPSFAFEWIEKMISRLIFDLKNEEEDLEITNCSDHEYVKSSLINENYKECSQADLFVGVIRSLREFVSNKIKIEGHKDLLISEETFYKAIHYMDIVTVNSTRSSCFTKK